MSNVEPTAIPRITFGATEMAPVLVSLPPLSRDKADWLTQQLGASLGRYIRAKQQDDTSPSRPEVRKLLKSLAHKDRPPAGGATNISESVDAEFLIRLAAKSRGQNIDDVSEPLNDLQELASDALKALPDRRGPQADASLWLFLWTLLYIYEALTEKKATHNPYEKTQYNGGNDVFHSACDRFVRAVMRMIHVDHLRGDPIDLSLVATYMQQIIRQGVTPAPASEP